MNQSLLLSNENIERNNEMSRSTAFIEHVKLTEHSDIKSDKK